MGNSNKNDPAGSFIGGHQSQQGPASGGARQFDGGGNMAIAGAAAPPKAAAAPPPPPITLADAQLMALKITTCFEGSKPINYQALADDHDGQGMSFGLIQWNFGKETLDPLLKKMLAKNEAAFRGCFGPSTHYGILKSALDHNDNAVLLKWTRELEQRDRPAWEAAFHALGAIDEFNAIQLATAVGDYHKPAMHAIAELRQIAPALMAKVEFRSYAALFDLCVQQGSIDKALDTIGARVTKEKPDTQLELLEIVVVERGRRAGPDSQADCISRRMGILTGAPYKSTESGKTYRRENAQFGLALRFGAAQIAGI